MTLSLLRNPLRSARPARFSGPFLGLSFNLPFGLLFSSAALLSISGCSVEEDVQISTRDTPDVILITLDTTRPDHLGVYGYPRETSPFLDAFAREAKVFDRAWSTAPWTLPAHASMLTGKYPSNHGAHYVRASQQNKKQDYDTKAGLDAATLTEVLPFVPKNNFRANRLAERHETLAELLQARGYATGAFAAGHWLAPAFGLLQGYSHRDAHVPKLEGRPAAEMTSAAITWLEAVPEKQPAHLLINYFDPHDPHSPAPSERLDPKTQTRSADDPFADRVDRYDAEIRIMDREIGRFFDAMRRLKRFENAVIVLVADHGEFFGEHGRENHGPWLDEELVRVPLLVRFPNGREGGIRVETPVSIVDLLPMIAEEVEFKLPESVDGRLPGQPNLILSETRSSDFHVRKFGNAVARDLQAVVDWPWKLVVGSNGAEEILRLDAAGGPTLVATAALDAKDRARLDRLRERLIAANAAFGDSSAESPDEPQPARVSDETEANLRALGYIE